MAGESFLRGMSAQRGLTPPDLAGMAGQQIGGALGKMGGALATRGLEELFFKEKLEREEEMHKLKEKMAKDEAAILNSKKIMYADEEIFKKRKAQEESMKMMQEIDRNNRMAATQFAGFTQAGDPQVQEGVLPGFEGPSQAPRAPTLEEGHSLKPFMEARQRQLTQAGIQGRAEKVEERFQAKQAAKPKVNTEALSREFDMFRTKIVKEPAKMHGFLLRHPEFIKRLRSHEVQLLEPFGPLKSAAKPKIPPSIWFE